MKPPPPPNQNESGLTFNDFSFYVTVCCMVSRVVNTNWVGQIWVFYVTYHVYVACVRADFHARWRRRWRRCNWVTQLPSQSLRQCFNICKRETTGCFLTRLQDSFQPCRDSHTTVLLDDLSSRIKAWSEMYSS